MAALFLTGADITASDAAGYTPLAYAAAMGNIDCVTMLLKEVHFVERGCFAVRSPKR